MCVLRLVGRSATTHELRVWCMRCDAVRCGAVWYDGRWRGACMGCQTSLIAGVTLVVWCSRCTQPFCIECDIYVHEQLHNCPGCLSSPPQLRLSEAKIQPTVINTATANANATASTASTTTASAVNALSATATKSTAPLTATPSVAAAASKSGAAPVPVTVVGSKSVASAATAMDTKL